MTPEEIEEIREREKAAKELTRLWPWEQWEYADEKTREQALMWVGRILKALRSGGEERRLGEPFVGDWAPKAETARFMGEPVQDLSRRELMAALMFMGEHHPLSRPDTETDAPGEGEEPYSVVECSDGSGVRVKSCCGVQVGEDHANDCYWSADEGSGEVKWRCLDCGWTGWPEEMGYRQEAQPLCPICASELVEPVDEGTPEGNVLADSILSARRNAEIADALMADPDEGVGEGEECGVSRLAREAEERGLGVTMSARDGYCCACGRSGGAEVCPDRDDHKHCVHWYEVREDVGAHPEPTDHSVTDARSAYMNLRTCKCGRDARYHVGGDGCNGFDPDWDAVRADLESRQAGPEPTVEGEEEARIEGLCRFSACSYCSRDLVTEGHEETCMVPTFNLPDHCGRCGRSVDHHTILRRLSSRPEPTVEGEPTFAELEADSLRAMMYEFADAMWPGDREWEGNPDMQHIRDNVLERLRERPEGEDHDLPKRLVNLACQIESMRNERGIGYEHFLTHDPTDLRTAARRLREAPGEGQVEGVEEIKKSAEAATRILDRTTPGNVAHNRSEVKAVLQGIIRWLQRIHEPTREEGEDAD